MIRLTGGLKKGHKINTPKDSSIIRPALAQVREAIFSSLGDITNMVVFDVFAGTGSLGFEALSRGAKHVGFVEAHPVAIKCLIKTLNDLDYNDKATIYKRNMPFGLRGLKITEAPDVIFCDPPYEKNLLNKTLHQLVKYKFIDAKTRVIVEHTAKEVPNIESLEVFKEKKFGQTLLAYLSLKGQPYEK